MALQNQRSLNYMMLKLQIIRWESFSFFFPVLSLEDFWWLRSVSQNTSEGLQLQKRESVRGKWEEICGTWMPLWKVPWMTWSSHNCQFFWMVSSSAKMVAGSHQWTQQEFLFCSSQAWETSFTGEQSSAWSQCVVCVFSQVSFFVFVYDTLLCVVQINKLVGKPLLHPKAPFRENPCQIFPHGEEKLPIY